MAEQPPPEKEHAGRRKQVQRTVSVLLLLVTAVAVAWVGGKIVESVLVSGYRPPSVARRPSRSTRPNDPAWGADFPLDAAGLSNFRGDPGGVAPPPGSRRMYGVQRRTEDEVERQAHYRAPGPIDAAAAHYEAALAAMGYRRLKHSPAANRGSVLVFAKGAEWITVSLRTSPRNVKMVNVIVVAVTPDVPAPRK